MLLKPGEGPPGKARLAIPLQGLAQSRLGAEPRFDQPRRDQSRLARKPKGATPESGKPQEPGRTAHRAGTPEHLAGRVRRIPAALGSASSPSLFPRPGRVGSSTRLFDSKGTETVSGAGGRLGP